MKLTDRHIHVAHMFVAHTITLPIPGTKVMVLSWWGRTDQPGTSDTQGVETDTALPLVFEVVCVRGGGVV